MVVFIEGFRSLIERNFGIQMIDSVFFKILFMIAATAIIWMGLLIVLVLVNKWARKFKIIRFSDKYFQLIKRILGLSVVYVSGLYIIRLTDFPLLEKIFSALFILLLSSQIHGIFKTVLQFVKVNITGKTKTNVDDIVIDILDKFAGVIVYISAIIIALDTLGINVMPFIAGAGVAGIAIGFAAKDTLSNLIAGVLLLIDRPFEIGDRIEVWSAPSGSATWGDVMDIGIRATKINTTDNIEIIIPNNEIMTRDIVNYTASSSSIRVRVNVGIAYKSDIETAKQAIIEVAESIDYVQKEPAPKVVVRNFGDSSIELQLRVWIHDARKRMDTISDLTDEIKGAFDRVGIEIPFPQRDVTLIREEETK